MKKIPVVLQRIILLSVVAVLVFITCAVAATATGPLVQPRDFTDDQSRKTSEEGTYTGSGTSNETNTTAVSSISTSNIEESSDVSTDITPEENKNPKFDVIYKLDDGIKGSNGNYPANLKAPEQTFNYYFEAQKVTQTTTVTTEQMPDISTVTVDFKLGTGEKGVPNTISGSQSTSITASVEFDLSGINWPGVGVYYYNVRQEAAAPALGVTYSQTPHTLKITVLQGQNKKFYVAYVTMTSNLDEDGNSDGEHKSSGFVNTYTANTLTVSKEVTGNMGDREKQFTFDITLKHDKSSGLAFGGEITIGDQTYNSTNWSDADGALTFTHTVALKHGESVSIQNVPVGITYTVKEHDYTSETNGKYDAAKYSLNNGEAQASANGVGSAMDKDGETVKVINNKGTNVDTGISLDSLPYVLLLAFVGIGAFVVIEKKHSERE